MNRVIFGFACITFLTTVSDAQTRDLPVFSKEQLLGHSFNMPRGTDKSVTGLSWILLMNAPSPPEAKRFNTEGLMKKKTKSVLDRFGDAQSFSKAPGLYAVVRNAPSGISAAEWIPLFLERPWVPK
jgi:hypothetical protein